MNDYRIIFQKRANDYHFAMQEYPYARSHEFKTLISTTDFSTINEVLDIPSGGGYLKKSLPNHVNVTFSDFSEGFIDENIKLVTPEKLPFESKSFDVIFSLSGMHHLNDVPQFVEECLRVINDDGKFIFSDVKKDSSVAVFLNEFVNEHNSLGHTGDFFYEDYFEKHPNIQSKIIDCQYNEYPFVFNNQNEMINFFKLFFGLDKASDTIIYEGVRDILGINTTSTGLEVNWGLLQFKLKK
jgi:SAM-dependent methyltransferase